MSHRTLLILSQWKRKKQQSVRHYCTRTLRISMLRRLPVLRRSLSFYDFCMLSLEAWANCPWPGPEPGARTRAQAYDLNLGPGPGPGAEGPGFDSKPGPDSGPLA